MKLYVSSHNGVLDEYKEQVEVATPRDADKLVIWQDCAGAHKELAETCKRFFPKPIYVMQHGRRASRDYHKPLCKPFNADTFLAWGKWDYDNVLKLGKKSEIVGCPFNTWIKPRVSHKEKVILFVPVSTGKEEPDNIRVYSELVKYKISQIQNGLLLNYEQLRNQWDSEKLTRSAVAANFTLLTKVLPWHDHKFYTEGIIKGFQESIRNNQLIFDLLRNVDLVVGLDEGTTELFAVAHDVPVVIVDGFEYRWKEGKVKPPRTPGMTHCSLEQLPTIIDQYLTHPEFAREQRAELAENEMSVQSIKNPIKRLHEVIGS